MNRQDLAIIIPAYNEERTIARVVDDARTYGAVIVVDDGSKDRTAAIATATGADLVALGGNRGYEGALTAGFERAVLQGFGFAITLDADGQLSADYVPAFLSELDRGIDLVIGIRDRRPRKSETLFAAITRRLLGIRDPLCGIKGYRLDRVARIGPFDTKRLVGSEMAIRLVMRGARLSQLPITVRDRADESRYGVSWKGEWNILKAIGRAATVFWQETRNRGLAR